MTPLVLARAYPAGRAIHALSADGRRAACGTDLGRPILLSGAEAAPEAARLDGRWACAACAAADPRLESLRRQRAAVRQSVTVATVATPETP